MKYSQTGRSLRPYTEIEVKTILKNHPRNPTSLLGNVWFGLDLFLLAVAYETCVVGFKRSFLHLLAD